MCRLMCPTCRRGYQTVSAGILFHRFPRRMVLCQPLHFQKPSRFFKCNFVSIFPSPLLLPPLHSLSHLSSTELYLSPTLLFCFCDSSMLIVFGIHEHCKETFLKELVRIQQRHIKFPSALFQSRKFEMGIFFLSVYSIRTNFRKL